MGRIIKRYKSTIYGPYRVAYLRSGGLTALLLVGYIVVSGLFGRPLHAPENYGIDIILFVAIFAFTLTYRNALPDHKVTFKELILLGLGIAATASLGYGLFVWLYAGVLNPEQCSLFAEGRIALMVDPEAADAEAQVAIDRVRHYSAFDWGFIAFFRSLVMGSFIAFFAAIVFRTEKGQIISKTKK
ncbi:MAG: DUF4199 domain-containing protein [Bacteroidales bacterium]|nr:DUF4199 domain-containing protein [Bacteroidales bacterium]